MGSKSERSGRSRAWTALALVAGAALVWGFWATLDRFLAAGESVAGAPARAARELAAAARGLVTADVTERFVSSLPVAHGAARLELATAETVETISRSDERRAFWDLVPLGTTTVEIRVPVTWRWHVPLDGDWSVVVEEGVLTVDAPPLRPSLPPAIHTDGIERRVESDWLRFDGGEQLARLERELTPLLSARARQPRLMAFGRAAARDALADLALEVTSRALPDATIRAIVVRFGDEPPAAPHALGRD
ncbi:MAG: hypothetical protein KDB94_13875 [Acidobacteria bacterium]|nr:hypothetical protein [Acidobacteriota bacterium]